MPIVCEKPLIEILCPNEQHDRLDFGYYLPEFVEAEKYLEKCQCTTFTTLGEVMESDASYGVLPPSSCYQEEGAYLVRSSNISNEGVDYESAVRVPKEWINTERARIKRNDILISIKGARAFFDICVVSEEPPESIVNGSIFRLQCKPEFDPNFVVLWLLSKPIQSLVFRERTNLGISYISLETLKSIYFPNIPKKEQETIVNFYSIARSKLSKANILPQQDLTLRMEFLKDLDIVFSSNFDLPEISDFSLEKTFVLTKCQQGDRLDVGYNQPNHLTFLKKIKEKCSRKLVDFVQISDERLHSSDIHHYIGLEHVSQHIGEFSCVDCEPDTYGSSFKVSNGQFLYGRLRPYLNKIIFVNECDANTGCSTEFYVCQSTSPEKCELISHYLRSSYGLRQLEFLPAGGALPRVSPEEFTSVICPDFDIVEIKKIINQIGEVKKRYKHKMFELEQKSEKLNQLSDRLYSDPLRLLNIEYRQKLFIDIDEALK